MTTPTQFAGYGVGVGIKPNASNVPVILTRAPATTDWQYPLGQIAVNKSGNAAYILTSFSSSAGVTSANWLDMGGGSGTFTSLTVTGQTTLAATTIVGTTLINASGSAVTTIGTGGTGAVNIGNATGNTAVTGSLTASTSLTATAGDITATSGNLVVTAAADGLVFTNAASTSGTTTATLNGRVGQVTITTPSIAGGATFAMTISNTSITGSSTQVMYCLSGGTTGSALSIQSYANTSHQSVVTINNGTGATTNSASLILNFIVLN